MQHLEVSCAVRRLFKSLGFNGLKIYSPSYPPDRYQMIRVAVLILLGFSLGEYLPTFRKIVMLSSSGSSSPRMLFGTTRQAFLA